MNNGLVVRQNKGFPSIFNQDIFDEAFNTEFFNDFEKFFGNLFIVLIPINIMKCPKCESYNIKKE